MNLLLDTHVFLWFRIDPDQLGQATLSLLKKPSTRLVISVISTLEVAQLVFSGRLALPCDADSWMAQTRHIFQARELPLGSQIATEAYRLPGEFHRDLADRILVASARVEGLVLVTGDRRILDYPHVRTLDARL